MICTHILPILWGQEQPKRAGGTQVHGSSPQGPRQCQRPSEPLPNKGQGRRADYQVREQWLHSVPLIWRPGAAAPRWARAGMLGDPRACSCPAKLVMLHGAALLTQFFPSSWGWDWGWKGVVGGRKLSETHKSGAQKGLPALLGNPRRRGWHL